MDSEWEILPNLAIQGNQVRRSWGGSEAVGMAAGARPVFMGQDRIVVGPGGSTGFSSVRSLTS